MVKPILPDVREFIRGSPVCKGPTRKRKGKNGDFWGCLRYPDCNGIVAGKRKKQAGRRGKTGAARAKITAKQ